MSEVQKENQGTNQENYANPLGNAALDNILQEGSMPTENIPVNNQYVENGMHTIFSGASFAETIGTKATRGEDDSAAVAAFEREQVVLPHVDATEGNTTNGFDVQENTQTEEAFAERADSGTEHDNINTGSPIYQSSEQTIQNFTSNGTDNESQNESAFSVSNSLSSADTTGETLQTVDDHVKTEEISGNEMPQEATEHSEQATREEDTTLSDTQTGINTYDTNQNEFPPATDNWMSEDSVQGNAETGSDEKMSNDNTSIAHDAGTEIPNYGSMPDAYVPETEKGETTDANQEIAAPGNDIKEEDTVTWTDNSSDAVETPQNEIPASLGSIPETGSHESHEEGASEGGESNQYLLEREPSDTANQTTVGENTEQAVTKDDITTNILPADTPTSIDIALPDAEIPSSENEHTDVNPAAEESDAKGNGSSLADTINASVVDHLQGINDASLEDNYERLQSMYEDTDNPLTMEEYSDMVSSALEDCKDLLDTTDSTSSLSQEAYDTALDRLHEFNDFKADIDLDQQAQQAQSDFNNDVDTDDSDDVESPRGDPIGIEDLYDDYL